MVLVKNGSKIEWTEITWNPTTGCTKIAPGCRFCYAEMLAKLFQKLYQAGDQTYKAYEFGFKPTIHPERFRKPKKWKKPTLVFVNSMSDLFHEDFPLENIQEIFEVMNDCPQHIFQILTKRHQRLAELAGELNWTDNIWMGVSVGENRSVPFINSLRKVPAKVRFISFEPLIESIEGVNLEGIDWAIIGGESPGLNGGMRPCNIHWIESLVEQCDAFDTAVFVKQLGGVVGQRMGMVNEFGRSDLKGGQFEKFPVHLQRREYPVDLAAHFSQFVNL